MQREKVISIHIGQAGILVDLVGLIAEAKWLMEVYGIVPILAVVCVLFDLLVLFYLARRTNL